MVDAAAAKAGLPGLDSLSMVDYLTGRNRTSPRTELQVDSNVLLMEQTGAPSPTRSRKLWKLFSTAWPSTPQGATGWACFPGPVYPNATSPSCGMRGECDKELGGCLFDLASDPTEHTDVAATEPAALARLTARIAALLPALFQPDRGSKDERACDQVTLNGGFYGPWVHELR